MANTYSAGIVTAYGAAVRGGYTGTYEEFCAQQAAFAENAEQVAEDRAAVEQIKNTFENQTVPAAVQQLTQAGAAQVQAVQAAGDAEERNIASAGAAQETRVLQAGANQESAVNAAGSTQVQAVQTAGATQVTVVQEAGTTQVAAVNAAGSAQAGAVKDKGAEVLASIPQDYSALSGEVADLKSAVTDIEFMVNGKSENLPLTDITTGKYVDSTGVIRNANVYQFGYVGVSAGETVIIDTTALSDTVIINICDSNKQCIRNIANWGNPNKYYINIDSGESFICVSVKTAEANLLVIYLNNNEIDISYAKMENAFMTDAILPAPALYFVRYATGEYVSSNGSNAYLLNDNLPKYISALLCSDTDTLCAIAFYSKKYYEGDTISSDITTNGYIKNESVRYYYGDIPQGSIYHAKVPENCKTIIISTKKPSSTVAEPIIKFDAASVANTKISKTVSENNDTLLAGWKYIYHFGVAACSDRSIIPVIPSQSVFDVRNASNLGYKCIEANVHKTSDGHYVVTHGANGNLGHDFNNLNGEDAYGTSISGNTLQYLKDNFRYYSSVADYRTEITTLEEFLHEAKLHNLIVMVQYVDKEELEIVKGIMGTRFFVYGNARSVYNGVINEFWSLSTKEEILARCELIKRPYIYGMGNPLSFSDSELNDIVNTLHQNGYYISSAYLSKQLWNKLSAMGFDFYAVTEPSWEEEVILDGKKLIFNQDGSISWTDAPVV